MSPAYTLPVWLTDEQLLCDEAVLFGLSEARPDEKIATIRLAFSALTAPLEKQIEQQQEVIGELNVALKTADSQSIQPPDSSPKSWFGGWPVGLFLAGLGISLFLCAATYLGTRSLAEAQLALLMAGLTGFGGCAAALLASQARYRHDQTISRLFLAQQDETAKKQLGDKAAWQQQKQAAISQLYQAEARLNQQQAQRDLLIRLFESEFDLARSLRHQVRDRYVDL